jgi:single-strand DNA-binding protein
MRTLQSGSTLASFSLAINRRFRSGEEMKEEVCFIDVTAFGKLAETVGGYLKKGRAVLVDGRLKQETWEAADGSRRSKHVVIAESVTFLGAKEGSSDVEDIRPEDGTPF